MQAPEMITVLHDRRILLGITGSIAACKSADLASKLTQAGSQVDVIMTSAAGKFVSPLTFQSVTGRRAYTDEDLWGKEAHVLHVGLAEASDAFLIAPATANTIAKLATGIADNLLSITALAVRCPLLIAPAMDVGMFEHPTTQENIRSLENRGVAILGPTEGRMASGLIGLGRMVEPTVLIGELRRVIGQEGSLSGRKVVVTAGGTSEPMDPVRSLTNRSSGKQGYSVAQAAIDQGAWVHLVSAPTSIPAPIGVEITMVGTAEDMCDAVLEAVKDADALIMAAAVADFKPADFVDHKIKRDGELPTLTLSQTVDILERVRSGREKSGDPKVVVGFAAESKDIIANAEAKLKKKELSFIVANDITAENAGFDADTNRVVIIEGGQDPMELPLMSKTQVAEKIIARVAEILGEESA